MPTYLPDRTDDRTNDPTGAHLLTENTTERGPTERTTEQNEWPSEQPNETNDRANSRTNNRPPRLAPLPIYSLPSTVVVCVVHGCVRGPAGINETGEGTERYEPPYPDAGDRQRLEEQEPGWSSFREIPSVCRIQLRA